MTPSKKVSNVGSAGALGNPGHVATILDPPNLSLDSNHVFEAGRSNLSSLKPVAVHALPSPSGAWTAAESVELSHDLENPVSPHAFPPPNGGRTAAESVELCAVRVKPVIPHEFPSSNGDRTAAESVELCEPHVKPVLLHAFPSPDRDRTAAESVELCDAHVPSDDCYVSSLFLAPPSDSNNVLLPSSNKRKNCQSEYTHIDVTTTRPSKTARKSHVCLNSSGSAPTRSFQHHALEHQLAEQKQPPCDSASIGTRCRRQIYYDYHTVAQASSYTGNQLHRQAQAAQAQASGCLGLSWGCLGGLLGLSWGPSEPQESPESPKRVQVSVQ